MPSLYLTRQQTLIEEPQTEIKEKIAQAQNAHKKWKKASVDLGEDVDNP